MRAACLLLVLTAAGARPAHADAKEWFLSLAPSYAVAYADGRTAHGGGAAVTVGYGLSDALSLHVTAAVGAHAADATPTLAAGTLVSWSAMPGLTYALDVIRLVPSFTFSAGAIGVQPGLTAFGIELGFQLDYLVSRRFAIGVGVHYQIAVTEAARLPMSLYAGPRLSVHF